MDVPQFIAGRFRIEGEIGKGGMGTVYRASHLGLQRSVAVKIIKSEFAGDPDVADRFMREARTMAKLRHQRAAMIFDAGNLPDGRHFIIMEFIEGRTLSETLAREGRLSAERAVQIATQVCDVLQEAHQLGIIHRDLKPSNIMLNDRGVCVLDFGVAKVLATSADSTATHASTGSGQIVGTPRYMSPEQCLGQRVGVRSDLYSLGVLLYEMLAGHPPFTDQLPSVVLVKQATAPPPPLSRLRQDIPRPLALAVHTLLKKRPEDRPQTAAVARSLLERSIVAAEPSALPDVEPMASMVAAVNHSRGAILRVAAPVVLVSIMGALLLVLGYSGPSVETSAALRGADEPAASDSSVDQAARLNGSRAGEQPTAIPTSWNSQPAANLSANDARMIAANFSHGPISDVVVVPAASGPAIVAVHDEHKSGATHFFVVERRSAGFRVVDHGALDTPAFHGATWHAETLDSGHGKKAALFTGTAPGVTRNDLRLVLYVPQTRQTYNLRVEKDSRNGVVKRIWSNNALLPESDEYRSLLLQRAREIASR
jgi:predicted Ser/Thr protein kinase